MYEDKAKHENSNENFINNAQKCCEYVNTLLY